MRSSRFGSRKLSTDFSEDPGSLFATAGKGFFFGYTEIVQGTSGNTAISSTGANVVSLTPMCLRSSYVIRHTTFNLITGVDGTTASFGLYDQNGNLVFDSGAFTTSVAAGGTTLTLVHTPVFIPRGYYDFAQACSSLTPTAAAIAPATPTVLQNIFNKVVANRLVAHATNLYNGVSLPATTGARLGGGSGPTMVLFEP